MLDLQSVDQECLALPSRQKQAAALGVHRYTTKLPRSTSLELVSLTNAWFSFQTCTHVFIFIDVCCPFVFIVLHCRLMIIIPVMVLIVYNLCHICGLYHFECFVKRKGRINSSLAGKITAMESIK